MKYELFNASGSKLAEKKDVQYDRFTFENGKVTALDALAQPTSTSYTLSGNANNAPSLFMEVGSLPRAFAVASISNSSMTLQADNSGDTQNLSTGLTDKDKSLMTTRLTIQLNKMK